MRTTTMGPLACVIAFTTLASVAAATEPLKAAPGTGKESFTATVIGGANMRLPGGGTFRLTVNVESWTSVEERKRLLGVLKEQGKDALLKETRKLKAGYILAPPAARWPSWEVNVASSIETPEGRIVRLFTERPIALEEAFFNTRSKDFEFGVMELKIGKDGKGDGVIVPAAKVYFDDKGQLVFETTPFATGPYKVMGVSKLK